MGHKGTCKTIPGIAQKELEKGPATNINFTLISRNKSMKYPNIFILLLLLLGFTNPLIKAQQTTRNASVTVERLTLSFNEQTRMYELHDINEGILVSAGIIKTKIDGTVVSTINQEIAYDILASEDGLLCIQFGEHFTVNARLIGDTAVTFSVEGSLTNAVRFTAQAPLSDRTMGCFLKNEKGADNFTLIQTLGIGEVPELKSLFDPEKDLALQVSSDGLTGWEHFHQWQMEASADPGQTLCRIHLLRNYYRDALGISYYAPIKKRGYFRKAPALAMTWVGIEGKFNRPDFSQRKSWLYPNIDWVAKNLLPYAGEMVFQLDDNYPIDDPRYMRDISDYIRSRGLIPGIWIAPFGVAPASDEKIHPEWFIHKPDGSAITTFSGLSYDDVRHYSSTVLNVNNDEAVNQWFAGFLSEVSNQWNYDYFKVDGIPAILKVYDQSVDGGGVNGVRRGLQIIRSVVGPEKYINTCWGLPLEGIDIVNGSRVGGDTEQLNQVVSQVAVAQNYLNNIAWYSDPDGAANMYASSPARARLNFQGRTLLGQPYVTDDNWTKVPDEILFVWQKTLPTIESFPLNLYPISDPDQYDHFNLKIHKPWGEWDIVGLNNYENIARQLTLDLGKLPLTAGEVYVYDFWNQKYLGTHARNAKINRNMEAIDAHCFSVVPVQPEVPVLISTNRHITQGGIDIARMSVIKENDSWSISGRSNHLIKDDPYDMVFLTNGFVLDRATVNHGSINILDKKGVARIRILPDQTEVKWNLTFTREKNLSVGFDAELVHLIPGQPVEIPVVICNGHLAHWKVTSSDKNIRVKEDHARSLIKIDVDASVLKWDSTWRGLLTLQSKDAEVIIEDMIIEVQGPARENIAGRARTSASTIYFFGDQNGYGRAEGVNDGRSFTAWEAAEGETDGWLEMIWEKPVTFQRIVIDEWMESGGAIQSWKLEAGYKKSAYTPRGASEQVVTYDPGKESMEEIALGESIGRGYVIELDKPVTANVLKISIPKASKRPGIWEIEVNPPTQAK